MTERTTDHIALNVPIGATALTPAASNFPCNRLSSLDRSTEEGEDDLTILKQQSSLATTRRSLRRVCFINFDVK